MDIKEIQENFDKGKPIFLQSIYDVDFEDIFIFEDVIGEMAKELSDRLKKKNFEIDILTDNQKSNVKCVNCKSLSKIYISSRKNFRVVHNFTEEFTVTDSIEMKEDIERLIKCYGMVIGKNKKSFSQLTKIKRIGIRFRYAVKIDQPHIKNPFFKDRLLQTDLINNIGCKTDLLYSFKFILAPDNFESKSSSIEKIVDLKIVGKIQISLKNGNVKGFENAVIVDFIQVYHNEKEVKIDFFDKALENYSNNVLSLFACKE